MHWNGPGTGQARRMEGGKEAQPPPSLMGDYAALLAPNASPTGSGREQATAFLLPTDGSLLLPLQQQQQQHQQQAVPLWPPGGAAGPWPDLAAAATAAAALQAAPAPAWLDGSVPYAGRLDPQAMAAKLAAAREKNRLAQQRFRARQRAAAREAEEQYNEVRRLNTASENADVSRLCA